MRTRKRGRRTTAAAATLALALALPLGAQAMAQSPAPADPLTDTASTEPTRQYQVAGVDTLVERTELARSGVSLDAVLDGSVIISATPAEAEHLAQLGHQLSVPPAALAEADEAVAASPADYHSYEEMLRVIDGHVDQYPDLLSQQVIGQSHEGRDIIAVSMSSPVGADGDKPEVLFTHNMHAREHLTAEMALYTIGEFASQYGTDERITAMLDERELWIIPSVNPDGKEYDTESGQFQMWRKNRQPNPGSTATGTDLNRNWPYQWGCCGGSSSSPSSSTYRGSDPGSGTETSVVTDFVESRVVNGEQRLTAHIDFHTYSELILWPYGYTYDDTAPGLSQDDRDAFAAVGTHMADSNGYTPQQSSDLYITDGSVNDWMWGEHGIFSYTFEMYPGPGSPEGFYPPGEVIDRETSRNRDAMLILLENADCMYRSIGKEQEYCTP